jgi:hypothetical protein
MSEENSSDSYCKKCLHALNYIYVWASHEATETENSRYHVQKLASKMLLAVPTYLREN